LEINVKNTDEINKLVDYLPKAIGMQALKALCAILSKSAIEENVNEIELKSQMI